MPLDPSWSGIGLYPRCWANPGSFLRGFTEVVGQSGRDCSVSWFFGDIRAFRCDSAVSHRSKKALNGVRVCLDCAFAVRTLNSIRSLLTASQFWRCGRDCCRCELRDGPNRSRSLGNTRSRYEYIAATSRLAWSSFAWCWERLSFPCFRRFRHVQRVKA